MEMSTSNVDLVQEAYREALLQSSAKSGTVDGAMSLFVLSIVAFLATFVLDLSSFHGQLVLLARIVLVGVIVVTAIVGCIASTEGRAADKVMEDLRNSNPSIPLPF